MRAVRTVLTSGGHRLRAIAHEPPWFVRALGGVIIIGDAYLWLSEHSPTTVLELGKHGILLAVGLACFYPEGLKQVGNVARRLPWFDRRSVPRDPPLREHD